MTLCSFKEAFCIHWCRSVRCRQGWSRLWQKNDYQILQAKWCKTLGEIYFKSLEKIISFGFTHNIRCSTETRKQFASEGCGWPHPRLTNTPQGLCLPCTLPTHSLDQHLLHSRQPAFSSPALPLACHSPTTLGKSLSRWWEMEGRHTQPYLFSWCPLWSQWSQSVHLFSLQGPLL